MEVHEQMDTDIVRQEGGNCPSSNPTMYSNLYVKQTPLDELKPHISDPHHLFIIY